VDLLLAAGADVSDPRAQSHYIAGALRSGDERTLQRLLDAGASSDSLALIGFPTLAHFMHPPGDDDVALNIPPPAARCRSCLSAIARRCDANVRCSDGRAALHRAARHGRCGDIRLVLTQVSADVDLRASGGCTALMDAACRSTVDVCRGLVDGGADLRLRTMGRIRPHERES
jgi:ankyrin repeat protein